MSSDEDEKPREAPSYNQTPFLYDVDNETETFGDRRKTPKLAPAPKAPVPEELAQMSERERKLAELKAKRAATKRHTTEAVIEEDRREKNPEQEAKRQRMAQAAKKEQERERDRLLGIDQEKKKILNTTAQDHQTYEKRKKKKQSAFGWSLQDEETHAQIYDRRMKDFKFSERDYERQKERLGEDDFYRTGHNLTYGQTTGVTVAGVNRMVEEMEKQADRRAKWSRRRAHHEDADVTYINERNKAFNEKVGRAYDKYSVTLKQNLERGTAV